MINYNKSQEILIKSKINIKNEIILAKESLNRISARNIYSPTNYPAGNNTASDGYAINSKETKGLSSKNVKENPDLKALGEAYDRPYKLKPNPQNTLIVGSGTGNDVARVHGYISDDLDNIIDIIINGVDRNIGALRIEAEPMPKEENYPSPTADSKWNGTAKENNRIVRWIFHETDSGITSLVSRAKLKRGKWIKGNLKYTYLGITEILKWRKRNAWVKIDNDNPVIINFSLFVFTLSEYFGGGYWVAPGASPIKDHAYLCKAWNLTRLQMLLLMGPLRKGKHVGKWGITLDKCRTLEIKSVNQNNEPVDIAHDPSLPINVDGEPCLQTPARIEFHPKQLWLRGSKDVSWDVS